MFRNYNDTNDFGAAGTDKVSIVDAACATASVPGFFAPVEITVGGVKHKFADPSRFAKNPAPFFIAEMEHIVWQNKPVVKCLVSLGTGLEGSSFYDSGGEFFKLPAVCDILHNINTVNASVETVVKTLFLEKSDKLQNYCRFNPPLTEIIQYDQFADVNKLALIAENDLSQSLTIAKIGDTVQYLLN